MHIYPSEATGGLRREVGGGYGGDDVDLCRHLVGIAEEPTAEDQEQEDEEDERDAAAEYPVRYAPHYLLHFFTAEVEVGGCIVYIVAHSLRSKGLLPQFELVLYEGVIFSFQRGEFFVCTLFHHAPFVEDDDVVGVNDGAQAVGYDEDGLAAVEGTEIFHNDALVVGIEAVGGFVEENELRVFVDGAGDEDPLSLSGTHTAALHADFRVVAERQRFHKFLHVGDLCGTAQAVGVDALRADGDVLRNRVRENKALLHHAAALAAPEVRIDDTERCTADADAPPVGCIEALKELDDGGLSAAAGPDDGCHLVLGNDERDVINGIVAVCPAVTERDVVEGDVAALGQDVQARGNVALLVLLAVDFVESLEADFRVLERLGKTDELADGRTDLPNDIRQGHHHAERHLPLDHRLGGEEGDDDARGLREEDGTYLLNLS